MSVLQHSEEMKFTIICSAILSTLVFDFAYAEERLHGGRPIGIEKAPYMCQVLAVKADGSGEQCGGSIIRAKPGLILTAGHCCKEASTGEVFKEYIIHCGETDFINDGTNQYTVEKAYPHPKYNGKETNYHNDVCILVLEEDIKLSDKVQVVTLANKNDKPTPGSKGIVSGWGTNPDHPNDARLYQLSMTIISSQQCSGHFIGGDSVEGFEQHEICAQDEDKNHCPGDSGGPFLDTKTGRQIGVVSYGPQPCTDEAPSVFAKVTDMANMDFINQIKRKTRKGPVKLGGRSLSLSDTLEDS